MRVDEFDFDLPEQLIALRPAVPRDSARLLVVREDGNCEHRTVRDLPQLLRAGDVLVVNDSKVIPARMKGLRYRPEFRPGRPARNSSCCCIAGLRPVFIVHSHGPQKDLSRAMLWFLEI